MPFAFTSARRSSQRESVSFCGPAFGVGHEVKPLADMGGAEARSAGIDRPDGVTRCFQVSVNNVEPSKADLCRNLFANESARSALADETGESRP
jgi:hypothetical protein